MELQNEIRSHNYDVSYQYKAPKQKSAPPGEVGYEKNPAWNQLLEWGRANPDIMMNYIKYPLERMHNDDVQAEMQSKEPKELTSDSKCSRYKEIENTKYLQQKSLEVSQQEDQQKLRFEIGDFQDEELNFDNQNNFRENKDIAFQQNNNYNFTNGVDQEFSFGDQIEQKSSQKEQFFKEALNQVFEPNHQNKTLINDTILPFKPKRAYKKRKSFNQWSEQAYEDYYSQTNINQRLEDNYFTKELLPKNRTGAMKAKRISHQQSFLMNLETSPPSRMNLRQKNKKITANQIKKNVHNFISKEEEFQQLLHLKRNEQIAYVDSRIRHYNQLKNMIIKNKSKDEEVSQEFKGLIHKNDRISVQNEKSINKETTEEEKSLLEKKMTLTPELLRMLSGKFQLYKNYQLGKYQPGYKMSLVSIANQFQLSTSIVSSLYEQWQSDPDFSNKIQIMQKHISLHFNNIQSESSKYSTFPYNIRTSSLYPENNFTIGQKMLEMRRVFTERFRKLKSKENRLYFLDECHKEMIMEANRVDEQIQGKEIHFSLMSLLGVKGRASWKVVKWSGKKYQQMDDMLQLYKNVRDDQQVDIKQVVRNNRSYLILDPVIVRQPQKIRRIQQMTATKVLLFPQFSKQLNPLQFWFSDVKGKLRMTAKSLAELNKVLQKFTDTDFGKYLSDSERYMSLALQKRDF